MKNQVFNFIVVLALLSFDIGVKAQRTDVKDKGLKGMVTSVTTREYGFSQSFGETSKGSLKETSQFDFDSKGNITKEYSKSTVYNYNNQYSNGKLISQDLFAENGYLYQKIKYTYTGNGYVKTTYNSDGSVKTTVTKRGNVLITKEGAGTTTEYLNAQGKEYKTDASLAGIDVTSSTAHNANGDPISKKMNLSFGYNGRNRIITFKAYKYDKHRNWTYREKYQDGSPDIIEERDIIYAY